MNVSNPHYIVNNYFLDFSKSIYYIEGAMKIETDHIISQAVAADRLGYTTQRISQLLNDGALTEIIVADHRCILIDANFANVLQSQHDKAKKRNGESE